VQLHRNHPHAEELRLKTFKAGLALIGLVYLFIVIASAQQSVSDWPQWRGSDRTGISKETGLLKSWPPGGPQLLWKAGGLGGGYSTPSVASGRVFAMGYRGNDEVVWALEVATGKGLWMTRVAQANYYIDVNDGSRSTPTVDGNRLYTLGASGDLVCLQATDGKLLWSRNMVREFGGNVPGWGYSESPLVDGDKVIATPGGRQATLVALNKTNGQEIWRAQVPQGDGAHYSSCIAAEVNGQRQYIQFLRGGVVGVDAKDGKFLWRYNSPANGTANCSTPIFHNNHVFAASGYNTGGGLVKLTASNNGGVSATEVYFTRQMQNHHGGMVLVGDYVYGFSDAMGLTCLDFKTGEVKWANRSVGKGSVTYADGHIYLRNEGRGTVALVEATPTAYVEKGRFDPPQRSGKNTWPHPVVAGGRLYLRDQDTLFCYAIK
jgi:outer membrane protein assembly factor BamB